VFLINFWGAGLNEACSRDQAIEEQIQPPARRSGILIRLRLYKKIL
jgi:hypothetical protein